MVTPFLKVYFIEEVDCMDTRYSNSGVILRRFFPEQLGTIPSIIIWAVVFAFNVLAIILIQNNCIYTVDNYSKEGMQSHTYFKECSVQTVEEIGDTASRLASDWYVIYTNNEGEKRIVCLDSFPLHIINRAQIKESTDSIVNMDGSIQTKDGKNISQRDYLLSAISDGPFVAVWETGGVAALTVTYLGIALIMLVVELIIVGVIRNLKWVQPKEK